MRDMAGVGAATVAAVLFGAATVGVAVLAAADARAARRAWRSVAKGARR